MSKLSPSEMQAKQSSNKTTSKGDNNTQQRINLSEENGANLCRPGISSGMNRIIFKFKVTAKLFGV